TALEKLPADRFASAAEFAEALQDKTYTSTAVTAAMAAAPRPGRRAGRRMGARGWGLAAALVLALAGALWGWLRPQPVQPLTQFSLGLRTNQGLQAPLATGGARIALSDDGRSLVSSGPAQGGGRS